MAEGRRADAMNSNVDILRLATAVANGGIGLDDLVGDAIASVGMARLVSQLPQLGAGVEVPRRGPRHATRSPRANRVN